MICFLFKLTDAALAHELVTCNGEPGADYYVLLGRLKIQQKNFIEAEENLKQAIVVKHEVTKDFHVSWESSVIQLQFRLLWRKMMTSCHYDYLLHDVMAAILVSPNKETMIIYSRTIFCVYSLTVSQYSCEKVENENNEKLKRYI